jgi:pseudouridine-5'-phosphate glycosidase
VIRPVTDLDIAPAVHEALCSGSPVVALESTIIAHGMDYPRNLDTAYQLERIVRSEGAVPATIAVLSGRLKVGLSQAQLDHLARAKNVLKASTQDLPFAIVTGRDAATTVAATIRIAAMAGIQVLATGGIGGVHRGAHKSFDISADITELGRTNVAVVSAGAKAILDLPATLEALETATIPVIGFQTDEFPAFYAQSSGLSAPLRLDSEDQIAAFLSTKWRLQLPGGALIANPIRHKDSIAAALLDSAIHTVHAEARAKKIESKALTPFLLARISALTEGRSLLANMALVKNNARLAARIAMALKHYEMAD